MKVTSKKLNEKKESILIDGEVFLKSVDTGKWRYIVLNTIGGREFVGKSKTLEAARKLTLSTTEVKLDISCGLHVFASEEKISEFKDKYSDWKIVNRRSSGAKIMSIVSKMNVERRIFEVDGGEVF